MRSIAALALLLALAAPAPATARSYAGIALGGAKARAEVAEAFTRDVVLGLTQPPTSPGDQKCDAVIDMMIVDDSSNSIQLNNWTKIIEFNHELINQTMNSSNLVQIGVVEFSKSVKLVHEMTFDKEALLKDVDVMPYLDSETCIWGGLMKAWDQFKAHGRDPATIPHNETLARKLVLMSDGLQNTCDPPYHPEFSDTATAAKLKADNIEIYVIGVGPEITQNPKARDTLKKIASSPEDYFEAKDFDELLAIIDKIKTAVCDYYSCIEGTAGKQCIRAQSGNYTKADCDNICVATTAPTAATPAPTGAPTDQPTVATPAPTGAPTEATLAPSVDVQTESPISSSVSPTTNTQTESPVGPSIAPTSPGGITGSPTAATGQYSCYLEKETCDATPRPGSQTYANLTLCNEKCHPLTPDPLDGMWRGISIEKGFVVEEYDVFFTKQNCYIKPQKGASLHYDVKYIKQGELQFTDEDKNIYPVKYVTGTESVTNEMKLLQLAIGTKDSAPIPSFDSAMTTDGDLVLSLAGCMIDGCDFSPSKPTSVSVSNTVTSLSEAILINPMTWPIDDVKAKLSSTLSPTSDVNEPCEADIMIVMDRSYSISADAFTQAKNFAQDIVGSFNVSETYVHIGVVSFSSSSKLVIPLSHDKAAIDGAIKAMPSPSEATDNLTAIGKGFESADKELYQSGDGRPGVKKLVILMTDGTENVFHPDPDVESMALRSQGAEIICLGVGGNITRSALESYAGDSSNVFYATTFSDLEKTITKIVEKACTLKYSCQNVTDYEVPLWLDPSGGNDTGLCLPAKKGETGETYESCLEHCKYIAPPPVHAPPGPKTDVYLCNATTHMCDAVPAGTPGATSKQICETICNPAPPADLLGIWRGIATQPGYTEGEYDLVFELPPSKNSTSFVYTFTDPSGTVSTGDLVTVAGTLDTFIFNGDLDAVAMLTSTTDAYDFGGETNVWTLVIAKKGMSDPSDAPSDIVSAYKDPNFDTFTFWSCFPKSACDFSSI